MTVRVKRNLGLTVIVTLILISGVVMFARSMQASTIINAGDDSFTTGTGSQSSFSFPAGFFGTGSQALNVTVTMVSDGFPDTVIHRESDVSVPGSTNLTLKTLALKSSSPVAVTFADSSVQYWNLKAVQDPSRSSAGSLSLNTDNTGTSTLNISYLLKADRNGVVLTKSDCPTINFSSCSMTWSGSGTSVVIKPAPGSGHQAPNHAHIVLPPG